MTVLSVVKGNSGLDAPRWTEDLRLECKRIVRRSDEGYIDVGRVLYELDNRKTENGNFAWQVWAPKYKTFREAVWHEFGMLPDRAIRFVRIYDRLYIQMEQLDPIVRGRLQALGFSKLTILMRVLTVKNAQEWLKFAEPVHVSFNDLNNKVRAAADHIVAEASRQGAQARVDKARVKPEDFDPDSAETEEPTRQRAKANLVDPNSDGPAVPQQSREHYKVRNFTFTDESWDLVDGAIGRMRQVTGSEIDGYNLSLICLQYLADADYGKGNDFDKALRTYMQAIESKMGIKLIAIDAKTPTVKYGYAALQELSVRLNQAKTEAEVELESEDDLDSSQDAQEGAEEEAA